MSGYANNDCTSTLSVNDDERVRFPCDGTQDTRRGNIVTWQTLVHINKGDNVSVKVDHDSDVFRSHLTLHYTIATSSVSNHSFRCTDNQRLSLIGEMKAKRGNEL